uniref:TIR domain-containing protein n=1 Tax=Trichobilharzia regenti TaxID=157069 RepID=A0AA85K1B3_TRIRE|nr:unnamed protein product [Trichobilharzia regenti]
MNTSVDDELFEKTSEIINQLISHSKSKKYDTDEFDQLLSSFLHSCNPDEASVDVNKHRINIAVNKLSKPSILRNLVIVYRDLGRKAIPLGFSPLLKSASLPDPPPVLEWIPKFITFQQTLTSYIGVSISFAQLMIKSDVYLTEARRMLNRTSTMDLYEKITWLTESIISGLNTAVLYEDEIINRRIIDYCLRNIIIRYTCSMNSQLQRTIIIFLSFTHTEIAQLQITKKRIIQSLIKYFASLINSENKIDELISVKQMNKVLRILALNTENKTAFMRRGVLGHLKSLLKTLPNDYEDEILLTIRIITSEITLENSVKEIKLLATKFSEKIINFEKQLRISSDVCDDDDDDDNVNDDGDINGSDVPSPMSADHGRNDKVDETFHKVKDDNQSSSQSNGHVMISYSHADGKIALQIAKSLQERNIKVWIDKFDMIKEIDVLDGMATAVEDASIVCILFSKAYQNGGNTEVEAKHALSRGKKRIFLRVERKFVPTHWLGAMLGTSRYIDFSGKYPYEDKIEELYQTIENLNSK